MRTRVVLLLYEADINRLNNSRMPTFLVNLATGRQGSSTARELLKAGQQVNALVRNRNSPVALALAQEGATIFEGGLEDEAAIRAATEGTQGIFLNLVPNPFGPSAELETTQRFLTAAREAKTVTTIVLTTAFHTDSHPAWEAKNPNYTASWYFRSKHACEQAVLASGFPHITILRPSWLMHNHLFPYSMYHFPELATRHLLTTAYRPETRMSFFDPDDIGKFAAAALQDPAKFAGKQILLGNENLTIEETAAVMSKVSGVEVRPRYLTDEKELAEMATKIPTLMFTVLANEQNLQTPPGHLDQYGIPLGTFEAFLEKNKTQLLQAVGVGLPKDMPFSLMGMPPQGPPQ